MKTHHKVKILKGNDSRVKSVVTSLFQNENKVSSVMKAWCKDGLTIESEKSKFTILSNTKAQNADNLKGKINTNILNMEKDKALVRNIKKIDEKAQLLNDNLSEDNILSIIKLILRNQEQFY